MTDWRGRKEALNNLLSAQPPQTDRAVLRTDAFDCVVCLVRVIYARGILSERTSHRETQDNLLLAYAWRRFKKPPEGYTPAELEEHLKLKQAAIVQADAGSSFEELFTSSVMNRTLWSRPDMAVVRGVAELNSTSAAWDFLPAPDADDPERRAENDLIVLDRRDEDADPNISLEEHINSFFGAQKEGCITRWDMASPPDYIRVAYYPNEASPILFHEIQSFVLSMYDVLEATKGLQHRRVSGVRYTLVGIVRDQDAYDPEDAADQGPPSRVRLYADDGRLHKLASNHIIASNDWKVANGRGYHFGLLYAHTRQMQLHPRVEFTVDADGPEKRRQAMNEALKMLPLKDSTDEAAQPTPGDGATIARPAEPLHEASSLSARLHGTDDPASPPTSDAGASITAQPPQAPPAKPLREVASSQSTRPQGQERLESNPSDRTLSSTSRDSYVERRDMTPRCGRPSHPNQKGDRGQLQRSRSPDRRLRDRPGRRRRTPDGAHRQEPASPQQGRNRDPSPRAERTRSLHWRASSPVGDPPTVPFESMDMRRRDSFRDGEPPRRGGGQDAGSNQPSSHGQGPDMQDRGNNHARAGQRRHGGRRRGDRGNRYH